MSFTVEDVVKRHRELTAERATIAARHVQEMAPVSEKLEKLEMWLLAKMNQDGIQNYKTPHGTAYQSRLTSVKLDDPKEFRDFILRPAAAQIIAMVGQMGGQVVDAERDTQAILNLIAALSLWDLADLRPGKKGIKEFIETQKHAVPGVSINEIVNVNVRGS